jgi:DNA-directed RNA polymerase specialized sigma24 family protein
MDSQAEKQLLEQLLAKDRDAQKRLYEEYAPLLMAICHRYVPDRADAEDVLQDCFIRIFERVHSASTQKRAPDTISIQERASTITRTIPLR